MTGPTGDSHADLTRERRAGQLRHAASECDRRAGQAACELDELEPQSAIAACLIGLTTALGAALYVLAEEIETA